MGEDGKKTPEEVPPGTSGSGENLCRRCNGEGKLADGATCPGCKGSGKVATPVGGA